MILVRAIILLCELLELYTYITFFFSLSGLELQTWPPLRILLLVRLFLFSTIIILILLGERKLATF